MKLRVIGYQPIGSPRFLKEFMATASELGVLDRLDVVGALPSRAEMLQKARQCRVGIAFMPTTSNDRNERAMAGASNKAFDYLACGLALLVSDLPEWKAMFVEPGFGLSCVPEEPESIREALRWFFENREHTRSMGQRGQSRIASEWNYETQFGSVLRVMQQG
jgi:glycosyltransferase involved in cell wall biosynthesis